LPDEVRVLPDGVRGGPTGFGCCRQCSGAADSVRLSADQFRVSTDQLRVSADQLRVAGVGRPLRDAPFGHHNYVMPLCVYAALQRRALERRRRAAGCWDHVTTGWPYVLRHCSICLGLSWCECLCLLAVGVTAIDVRPQSIKSWSELRRWKFRRCHKFQPKQDIGCYISRPQRGGLEGSGAGGW